MKSVDPNYEGFPLQNLFNANILCRRYEGCMYVSNIQPLCFINYYKGKSVLLMNMSEDANQGYPQTIL